MYDYQCGSMPPSAHQPSTFHHQACVYFVQRACNVVPSLSCIACVSKHRACAPQRRRASDGACSPLMPRSPTPSHTPSRMPSLTPSRTPSRTPSPTPSPTQSPMPSPTPSRTRRRTLCRPPRRPTASPASARCAHSRHRRATMPPSGSSSCALPAPPLPPALSHLSVGCIMLPSNCSSRVPVSGAHSASMCANQVGRAGTRGVDAAPLLCCASGISSDGWLRLAHY